jgi:hypothetical protein
MTTLSDRGRRSCCGRASRVGVPVVPADVVGRRALGGGTTTTIRGSFPTRRSTAPSRSSASVVDKLARRIASLPFDAYKRLDNDEREVVKGDALDALINRPLPGTSAVWLNHQIAQSLLIHGNALVAKLRNAEDEPPFGLFPLDWGFVSAYAPMGGRVEWWATTPVRRRAVHRPGDVLHFAWGAPSGQIGVSPAREARRHDPARGRGAAPPDRCSATAAGRRWRCRSTRRTRSRSSSTTPASASRRCTRASTTRAARSSWART